MNFCPHCGKESLRFEQSRKWLCTECGFTLYHNVAAAVAVLIRCGGKIFFTVRAQEPKAGMLDLPGGFTDPEESGEETCSRELKEELSMDILPEKFRYLGSRPNLYTYKNITYRTLDLFYETDTEENGAIQLEESEISDYRWIDSGEIPYDELAFDSQKDFLKSLFAAES